MSVRAFVALLALGGVAFAEGLPPDQQRIADRYRELLLERPLHPSALERLWRVYSAAGVTEELIAPYVEGESRNPADAILGARLLRRADQPDAAASLLEPLAAGPDAPAELLELYAEILLERRAFTPAAKTFEKAAEGREPADAARLLLQAAIAHANARNAPEAVLAWSSATRLSGPAPEPTLRIATVLAEIGAPAEALALLDQAAAGSDAPELRLALLEKKAELANRLQDFDAAISAREQILRLLGPNHWKRAEAESDLIRLHDRTGSLEELRSDWEAELERFPKDPARIRRLARLEREQHQPAEEAELLERLTRIEPEDTEALDRLANLRIRLGDWNAAAATLDRLLALHPEDPRLHFRRAEVALRQNRTDQAVAIIERHLADSPTADRQAVLAFYRDHGLHPARLRLLEKTLDSDPHATEAALELATWHLERRETEPALDLLEKVRPEDPASDAQAEWYARIGDLLDRFGIEAAALYWVRRAAETDPANSDAVLRLAEILVRAGQPDEARSRLEALYSATPPGETRKGIDQRLYSLLQAMPPETNQNATWLANLDQARRTPGSRPPASEAVQRFIEELRATWKTAPDPTPALRLAHWLDLSGDTTGALLTLNQAVSRFPDDRDARLALIDLQMRDARLADAAGQLAELIERTPEADRSELVRRLARIQLERGENDTAIDMLQALATESPDAADRQVDLAIAFQISNRWFEALEAWKDAYHLAAPERRIEIVRSMLPVFDRIAAHSDAEQFLFQAAAEETNPERKLDLYQTAARYEVDHQRVEQARNILGALSPEEAATLGARAARIALEPTGSPEREKLIASLAEEGDAAARLAAEIAGASGEDELAASVRADGVLASKGASAAEWIALAQAHEQAGDLPAAANIWQQAVNVHSSDRALLTGAAEFFRRQGRWQEELQALRHFGSTTESAANHWLRLAFLEERAGNEKAAEEAARQVLLQTTPLDATALPLTESIPPELRREAANITFRITKGYRDEETRQVHRRLSQASEHTESATQRIDALELLSRLGSRPAEDLDLSAADRALLAAEQGDLREAATILAEPRDAEAAGSEARFHWLLAAFKAEAYEPVVHWMLAEPEEVQHRSELASLALSIVLGASNNPSEDRLAAEFSVPVSNRKAGVGWIFAQLVADHGFYRAAARGGLRAFQASDSLQNAERGVLLGKWLALSDRRDAARRVLKTVIQRGGPGFYDPSLEASRLLWRLSDPSQQQALLEGIRQPGPEMNPGILFAQSALWNEMAGHPEAADQAMREWVAFMALGRSSFSAEGLGFAQVIRSSIDHLENFGLPRLALSLVEAARQQDSMALLAQGEVDRDWPRELRAARLRLAIQLGNSDNAEFLIRDIAPEPADLPHLKSALRSLSENAQQATALMLAEKLLEIGPDDLATRQLGVHLARKLGDQDKAAQLLEAWLTEMSQGRPDREQIASIERQLVSTYREAGRIDQAIELMSAPGDLPLPRSEEIVRNELLASAGHFEELERRLRDRTASATSLPGSDEVELAEFLSHTGREQEALEWTEELPRTNDVLANAARSARLRAFLMAHDEAGVQEVLSDLAAHSDPTRIRLVVEMLEEARARNAIAPFLQASLEQAANPGDYLYIAGLLFERFSRDANPALLDEVVRRVLSLSDSSERNLSYFSQSLAAAPRHPADSRIDGALQSAWRQGIGPAWVGAVLIERSARSGETDAARAVLSELLARQDVSPETLSTLGDRLETAGATPLATPLRQRVLALRRNHLGPLLAMARNLWQQGRRYEALTTLDEARKAPLWQPKAAIEMARFYVSVNRPDAALRYLDLATPALEAETQAEIRAEAILELLRQGRFPEAEQALRIPGEKTLPGFGEAAARLLARNGTLETLSPTAAPFELTGNALQAFRTRSALALVDHPDPDKALAWIREATRSGDPAEAREALVTLSHARPFSPALAETWDALLARDQRYDTRKAASEASHHWASLHEDHGFQRRLLERAIELDPANIDAAQQLAHRIEDLGDLPRAIAILEASDRARLSPPDRLRLRASLDALHEQAELNQPETAPVPAKRIPH